MNKNMVGSLLIQALCIAYIKVGWVDLAFTTLCVSIEVDVLVLAYCAGKEA